MEHNCNSTCGCATKITYYIPEKTMTLKYVIAFMCSDVDIYLLREQDQETDKDRLYSASEIRSQLRESSKKLYTALKQSGIDVDMVL